MEELKFISQTDLAKALGVSRFTIINWNPPCYRAPNGSPRYILSEVIAWMKENGEKKEG